MRFLIKENANGIAQGIFLHRYGFQIIGVGHILTLRCNRYHILYGSWLRENLTGLEFHLWPLKWHRIVLGELVEEKYNND